MSPPLDCNYLSEWSLSGTPHKGAKQWKEPAGGSCPDEIIMMQSAVMGSSSGQNREGGFLCPDLGVSVQLVIKGEKDKHSGRMCFRDTWLSAAHSLLQPLHAQECPSPLTVCPRMWGGLNKCRAKYYKAWTVYLYQRIFQRSNTVYPQLKSQSLYKFYVQIYKWISKT